MAGYSPPMRGPDTLKARMSQAASAFIAGVLIASPSCSLANPVPGGGWADSIAGLFGTEFGDANSANLLNRIFGPLFPAESGSVDATTVSVLVGQAECGNSRNRRAPVRMESDRGSAPVGSRGSGSGPPLVIALGAAQSGFCTGAACARSRAWRLQFHTGGRRLDREGLNPDCIGTLGAERQSAGDR